MTFLPGAFFFHLRMAALVSQPRPRIMTQSPDSDTTTEGIRVHAQGEYVADQSNPDNNLYFFAYTITITNEGESPAQLLSRHWIILDSNNTREDVRGRGVVGETPRLEAGQHFQYRSACPLGTAWGTMEGTFQMKRDDGSMFDANIGRFFLVSDELKPSHRS